MTKWILGHSHLLTFCMTTILLSDIVHLLPFKGFLINTFVYLIFIYHCNLQCGFFKRKKINRQYLQIETCPLEEGDSNSMTQAENGDGSLKHQKKMNIVHLDYADVRGNSRIE